MRLLLLASAFALLPLPAFAQAEDEQLWLSANGIVPLDPHTRVTVETVARFSDHAGGFFHDEFGGLLARTVSKTVELGIGYRHVEDYDHGRAKPSEERLRQQVTVALGGGFSGRLRLEERFQSTGSQVGVRLRPQLRYTRPFGRSGGAWALFAGHESFLNLNDTRWGQRSGYERMRNTIGITVPLAKSLKADTGYLNQYRFGQGGARDQMDHAATFALTLTL